jgi:hypothetical protein
MPLENLVGNKFISDLNENWPAGTDLPDAGDDHLRGIKNVLKKTFPNINGPVTLSDEDLNRGSVPAGSIMAFYMAAAPAGWSRTGGIGATYGIRIVASASAGGGSGGIDDPILNNRIPDHTHGISLNSGTESSDHSHGFGAQTGGQSNTHSHGVNDSGHSHTVYTRGGYQGGITPYPRHDVWQQPADVDSGVSYTGISIQNANADHSHYVSGSTGGRSAAHTHSVSGNTGGVGGAANWQPRYVDMILCTKD